MNRITALALTGLVSLALAACGSSNKSSSNHSTPTSAAVASTPTSTGVSSTPTSTGTSSTPTGTSTSGTSTVAAGTGSFKTQLAALLVAGQPLGTAIATAVLHAGKMSNTTVASTFGGLGARVGQFEAQMAKLQPPGPDKAKFGALLSGYTRLAGDLSNISKLASQNGTVAQGRAAGVRLVRDVAKTQVAARALLKAVGLPAR
jgi:hypothetical protein